MVARVGELTDRKSDLDGGADPQGGKVVRRGSGELEGAVALHRVLTARKCKTAYGLRLVAHRPDGGWRLVSDRDEFTDVPCERRAGEYHDGGRGRGPHLSGVVQVSELDASVAGRIRAVEQGLLPDHQEEPARPVLLGREGYSGVRLVCCWRVDPLRRLVWAVDVDRDRRLVRRYRGGGSSCRPYREPGGRYHQDDDGES